MKLYHLTSPNIKGHVEVIYQGNGRLLRVNFGTVEMNDKQIDNYKNRVPVLADHIYKYFEETEVTVTEKEFEVTFEDFTREYPYSRNTFRAKEQWPKMTSGQQYLSVVGAIPYRKYCVRNADWYKPMAADRFLKEKQYDNNWDKL
ncbi:hypothetical protein [Pinibacter soli]|uniref:DUF2441 domain-containing protein n=1 Tax=Pinibacter soli TaxID=3044211 RepID=A0ABT6R9A6_9BACT|nr:hypothetical protein [Pinibacter soli]MDI3319149.1 hypothetical protein [Pinibacter soli]